MISGVWGWKIVISGHKIYDPVLPRFRYKGKNAMQDNASAIRIGSSPMTPAQLLMQLWPKIQEHCPDLIFQIIPFENTPENAREILANLGKNIDVVAGIFDETMLDLRHCAGLPLSREPFCCAVSIHHRLAVKDKLKIRDLYGENLMLMRRDWSNYVDRLRDDLWQNHSQMHIIDFDFYSMGLSIGAGTAMTFCLLFRDGLTYIRF